MPIKARLAVATQVVREAGDLAAGFFARRATLTRETKGPQDFVSVADREVEALIRTRLAEAFPEDGLLVIVPQKSLNFCGFHWIFIGFGRNTSRKQKAPPDEGGAFGSSGIFRCASAD